MNKVESDRYHTSDVMDRFLTFQRISLATSADFDTTGTVLIQSNKWELLSRYFDLRRHLRLLDLALH